MVLQGSPKASLKRQGFVRPLEPSRCFTGICYDWIEFSRVPSGISASLIYKDECLFVCSRCIWTRYVPVHPNFPRILISSRRRSWATFFPKVQVRPPSQTPLCFQPMELQYFLVCPKTSHHRFSRTPFGWNPVGWLRTNRNSVFKKSLNLNGIVAKTVLEGFLGAAMSNLMSIRLEIVLFKLEPISDK